MAFSTQSTRVCPPAVVAARRASLHSVRPSVVLRAANAGVATSVDSETGLAKARNGALRSLVG